MKPVSACTQCRVSKRKCRRINGHGGPCEQCRQSRLDCSFRAQQPQPPPWQIRSCSGPYNGPYDGPWSWPPRFRVSADLGQVLVEKYIKHIHNRPHSIFHPASLRSAVRNKQLLPGLYCALLSLGARFHEEAQVSALTEILFEDAKNYLHMHLENFSLQNIQACILVAYLSAAAMKPSSEALYLGIAINMAQTLQINIPDLAEPILIQELKRRIWWSLFMSDYWCATGNGISRKMDGFGQKVDLPMDELVFQGLTGSEHVLLERPAPGLWAHMITLVNVFGHIQELNCRITHQNQGGPLIKHEVLMLGQALTEWEQGLPESVKYSRANHCAHRDRGLGGAFVALYLGFYHYSTLLYYQFLDFNQAATADTKRFVELCTFYATKQSELLLADRELGSSEVLYPGTGHETAISSAVHLHTLLLGQKDETTAAMRYLKSNFEVIRELARYWPSLGLTVRRLTVFQSECLQFPASQTYKFNKRTAQFLLEYHLPLH